MTVRGFHWNSIGPKDGITGDPLGGDISVESGIELTFPITSHTKDMVRGHIYLNNGLLISNTDRIFTVLMENNGNVGWNSSLGAGILVKIGEQAKVELNAGIPIIKEMHSQFNRGIQVGIGVEFL